MPDPPRCLDHGHRLNIWLQANKRLHRHASICSSREHEEGYPHYRIPALIETRKGTLLAVADARHDSSHGSPRKDFAGAARTSHDRGHSWSQRRSPYVRLPKAVSATRLCCSIAALAGSGVSITTARPASDSQTPDPGSERGLLRFNSTQCSAMMTEPVRRPRDLTPQIKDPSWQSMFAASGTRFQTSTGRYLVPMVVRDAQGVVASRNAYSDDAGKTWSIGAAIGSGTNQSKCVELSGGAIMQNMRNGPTRAIALSNDGGVTFGPVTHDAALIDASCNAGIARYLRKHRDLLLFTNAADTKRQNLTLKFSAIKVKPQPQATVYTAVPQPIPRCLACAMDQWLRCTSAAKPRHIQKSGSTGSGWINQPAEPRASASRSGWQLLRGLRSGTQTDRTLPSAVGQSVAGPAVRFRSDVSCRLACRRETARSTVTTADSPRGWRANGDCGVVSTGENRGGARGTHGMLQRQPYARTRTAGRASANRIHYHQDGAGSRFQQTIDIRGSPRFLQSVLG